MKTQIRKRLVGKHRRGCHAVEHMQSKFWNTNWSYSSGAEFHNSLGYGHGYETWSVFKCNDIECNAKLLLNENDILKAAGEAHDS